MEIILYVWALMLMTAKAIQSYNILAVFPTAAVSHQRSCLGITKALAKRGHNVTVITTMPSKIPIPNHNEIDASFLFKDYEEYQIETGMLQTRSSATELLPSLSGLLYRLADAMLKHENIQRLLKAITKFDLILYEGLYPSALGLVHHFNYPPSVAMFTIPLYIPLHNSLGNPVNPSYISSFSHSMSDRMTFFQRLINTYHIILELYVHKFYIYPEQDKLVKKYFGPDTPSVEELERNNSMLLLSGDLSQSYPMALQPNTVQLGSLHVLSPKEPLQKDLKTWMDGATDGVIYFSLGSIMKGTSMSEDKRNAFAKAFARFPTYRIIWKWVSDDDFPGKPPNVLVKKWLPQQAVLEHPKTKLFISHCGHQSRQESIHHGIPILGVPLFWDQDWNCAKLVTSQAGLVIDFDHVTHDIVYEKIQAMLYDSRYKENMEQLSVISKDKPMTGPDAAVWWIEYVIRHNGAPHLRPAVQDLYWFQYLLLDVLAFVTIVVIAVGHVLCFLIRMSSCTFSTTSRKVKQN